MEDSNRCEFFLLANRASKRLGLSNTGAKTVCGDLLGDLAPLADVHMAKFRAEATDPEHVAGNYNRARVIIETSYERDDRCPMLTSVEGKKVGDQYHYNFTVEMPGAYHKIWPVISRKPLDFRNRESYKNFKDNISKFECRDEDVELLASYLPFSLKYVGTFMTVESPGAKGVYSIEFKEFGASVAEVVKLGVGQQLHEEYHKAKTEDLWLAWTKLAKSFDRTFEQLKSSLEHWKNKCSKGETKVLDLLSERWLQGKLLELELRWKIIYDLIQEDADRLLQALEEGRTIEGFDNEVLPGFKKFKQLCEHLATFDLEKFEEIDDEKIAGILESFDPRELIGISFVLHKTEVLNHKLSADRLMASLAKNLTPAQLEAIEQPAAGEVQKRSAMLEYLKTILVVTGRLLNPNPTFVYEELASRFKVVNNHDIREVNYVDLDEDRILQNLSGSLLIYDLSAKTFTELKTPEDFYHNFRLLGYVPSLSKAYYTCRPKSPESCLFEVHVPAKGHEKETAEPPTFIVSKEDHTSNFYNFFALHDQVLVGLEINITEVELFLEIWKLGAQPPVSKSKTLLQDLCIIDESSRDLFQEFKSLNIYTRRTAMIANSRQALIAVHIYSDYDYDSFGKTRIAGLCLAGVNFETKSHLALSKLEFETSLDRDAINYDYHLFKLKSKANTLACLSLDSRAGKCIVQALTGQKIVKILERPLPRRFPRLESDFQFMQVFCQRLMKMTFWRVEKRESKFKLMAYSWKVNL